MIRTAPLICLAVAALVSGCGGSQLAAARPAPATTPSATATATALATTTVRERARPRRGITVRAVRSRFGTIVANGAGTAFYLFDKERSARSECYGDCAKAWPPVLTKGRPVAGA